MSYYFTLSARGSSALQCSFFPPITLNAKKSYAVGLINFTAYNAIYNVTSANNTLHFRDRIDSDVLHHVFVPEGVYEIEDLVKFFKDSYPYITLEVNEKTLKTKFTSNLPLDFSLENSIGPLLGFSSSTEHHSNTNSGPFVYLSDSNVNISTNNLIYVNCSLVRQSFSNGHPSHVLHAFPITVPFGYKITESPSSVVYLPIQTRDISELTVEITNQDQKPINFNNEEITVVLHLIETA